MEQLNRVELRGIVGSVRIQMISGANVARFTVATNFAYRDKDGNPTIETTWHNVTAWESKENRGLDKLEKGSKVYLVGRLRNQRFIGADGAERTFQEILAIRVDCLNSTEVLECQV